MFAKVRKSNLSGEVLIPGSKSHMIRSLYFGALGKGRSIIRNPVRSQDSLSAAGIIRALGIQLDMSRDDYWTLDGGTLSLPEDIINVGNSGTSMTLGSALAASLDGRSVFTGDEQIRNRPIQPVLDALSQLGAKGFTIRDNDSPPFMLEGPLRGGITRVEGLNSQYVSSAILAATLAEKESEILVNAANETPYIEMTLQWMRFLGVEIDSSEDYNRYLVRAGQTYSSFDRAVPADFSSASFMLIGAAITDSFLRLDGLDMDDVQGDKILIDILLDMGADISIKKNGAEGIFVSGGRSLKGRLIDCSSTPDSVPILSVLGCFAAGETRLYNIESSRIKETDRPLLMVKELSKMGADIELLGDELVIRNSTLAGAEVESYGDHRIAMALCMAGLIASGETLINRIESAAVSYPGFDGSLRSLGADVEYLGERD
ncbi:MAG: 3-phosphoshikimate 1-carboxyvinyltransferase [Spirochaetales bacterium]|nr:3-phosphoshikimate 1-carboxyvinyltransferase [Spirochaetales bacterium]